MNPKNPNQSVSPGGDQVPFFTHTLYFRLFIWLFHTKQPIHVQPVIYFPLQEQELGRATMDGK